MPDLLTIAVTAAYQMKLTMDFFTRADVRYAEADRVLLADFTVEINGSIRVRPLALEGWVSACPPPVGNGAFPQEPGE